MAHTGAMIALFPDRRYLGRMARAAQCLPHAQSIEDLHVTVCYLGKAAELDKAAVLAALQQFSPSVPMPLLLRIRGLDRFPTREDDGTNALYARVICPELHTLRDSLIAALDTVGVKVRNDFGSYTPHVTLGYAPEYLPTPNVRIPLITIPTVALHLHWADDEPIVISMTEQSRTKEVSGPMATPAHGPGGLFSNPSLSRPTKHEEKAEGTGHAPPEGVRVAARRGLELRRQFGRGGTAVGIARARDLSNGKSVSDSTIKRMRSFFARHAVDKRAGWSNPDDPSNGYIAHMLWGGDAGGAWADKIVRSIDAETTTKPFASQAQQRFAFATGQPWAKRWADETDFSSLPKRAPKRKSKSAQVRLKANADGPGKRNYGARAGETIAGNLVRGADGKFHSGGVTAAPKKPKPVKPKGGKGAGAKPKKPKAPKLTPEERQAEREARRAATIEKNLAKTYDALGLMEDATYALNALRNGETVDDDGGLVKMGLAEQAADGTYRLTAAGRALHSAAKRGDVGAAKDTLSKAKDRIAAGAEAEAATAAAEAEAAAAEEKPKKGGGGGGGKKNDPKPAARNPLARAGARGRAPTGAASGSGGGSAGNKPMPKPRSVALTPDKPASTASADREVTARETANRVGLGKDGLTALRGAADGTAINPRQGAALARAGLVTRVGNRYEATDQGRQALNALERGNLRSWQSAIQNADNRLKREAAAAIRRAEAEKRSKKATRTDPDVPSSAQKVKRTHAYWKTYRTQRTKGMKPSEARRVARETVLRDKLGRNERQQSALLSALYQPVRQIVHTAKADGSASFTVFKTSRGLRWLAISSNNYEDRDREIVSKAALDADVARTAQDGRYGPLRWWHIGEPDPLSDEPWGPGLDLGWCDFAAMDDRFLIESGTFKDEEIGAAIAAKADKLALSIGFFHPRGEPDAEGVFHHIRRFERSLAPAGKVSNPLTAFYVPGETPMAMQDTQLKALADLLPGVPEEKIKALIDQSTSQATKTAEAAGLRYKADDTTDAEIAALEEKIATLKAQMKAPEAEAPPPATEEPEEGAEEYAGDMTIDQFKAILGEVVEKAIGAVGGELKAMNAKMNMAEKMGGMFDEMKAMFGGIQQKDASKAERIEQLERQLETQTVAIKTISLELAELRGDQPAAVVAASKSQRTALPADAAPADKFTVKTPDDKPAYAHPADDIGAWIEGSMAD